MPAPTLTQLFGASATRTGSSITIDFADFPALADPATAAPAKCLAAYLAWLVQATANKTDDPEWGIAASAFQNSYAFTTRGTQVQIEQTYTINAYFANPITELDPDNVV